MNPDESGWLICRKCRPQISAILAGGRKFACEESASRKYNQCNEHSSHLHIFLLLLLLLLRLLLFFLHFLQ